MITVTPANVGDLITFGISCGTTQTTAHITGITDSQSDVWNVATTTTVQTAGNYVWDTNANSAGPDMEIWFTKSLAAASTVISITFNSGPSYCEYSVSEDNTQAIAYKSNIVATAFYTAVNYATAQVSLSSSATVPSNSAIYYIGAFYGANPTQGNSPPFCTSNSSPSNTCTISTPAVPQAIAGTQLSAQTKGKIISTGTFGCVPQECHPDQYTDGGTFISAPGSTSIAVASAGMSNFASGNMVLVGLLGAVFSLNGNLPGQNSSTIQIGCPTTYSTSNEWNLTANVVYFFTYNTVGGVAGSTYSLINASLWVAASHGGNLAFVYYVRNNIASGQLPSISQPWASVNNNVFTNLINTNSLKHYSVGNDPNTGQGSGVLTQFGANAGLAVGVFATNGDVKVATCAQPFAFYKDNSANAATQLTQALSDADASPALWAWVVVPPTTIIQTVTNAILTVTSVVTIAAATVTQTNTVSGGGGINSAINMDNLLLGVIVLLGPSMIMGGVTKSLWGGILGATLGLVVGVYAGFLPFWVIPVVVIVTIAALFFSRQSQGGSI